MAPLTSDSLGWRTTGMTPDPGRLKPRQHQPGWKSKQPTPAPLVDAHPRGGLPVCLRFFVEWARREGTAGSKVQDSYDAKFGLPSQHFPRNSGASGAPSRIGRLTCTPLPLGSRGSAAGPGPQKHQRHTEAGGALPEASPPSLHRRVQKHRKPRTETRQGRKPRLATLPPHRLS